MKPLCGGDFSRFYLEDNYRTFFERSRPLHDYAISRYKLLYSRYSKGFRVRKFPLQGELPSKGDRVSFTLLTYAEYDKENWKNDSYFF
jgi:hypothetical protein